MEWISDWAGGIIIAVIIGTVIEMILPEGRRKKYIKGVIGVYVVFTIVTPVITKFTGETVEVSDILDLDTYIKEAEESTKIQNTIENDNQSSIMEMYSSGLKTDMKAKIEAKGYTVNSIEIDIADDESYVIKAIRLEVEEVNEEEIEETNEEIVNQIETVDSVNKVEISITNDSTSNTTVEKETSKDNSRSSISYTKRKELKEYLSGVYEVNENNITIN